MFRMLNFTKHLSQDIFLHASFKLIEIELFDTFTKMVIFSHFQLFLHEIVVLLHLFVDALMNNTFLMKI